MTLRVLGINHKTASVDFREKVAFNPERLTQAYQSLLAHGFNNSLILSTCNRTEIYYKHTDDHSLLDWFSGFIHISTEEIITHSYQYADTDMLTHMVRVASGLDSMILGEPQILGQLKQAFATANAHHAMGKKFAWVVENVFSATKRVRTDSKLGEQAVSIAFAVAKLAEQIFENLATKTLMLVAVGEMNQLVARHLCNLGVGKLVLANRSRDKAEAFAKELSAIHTTPISVIDFADVETHIHLADILCSCTASLDIIIPYKWAKKAIKKRRYQPQLLLDLAIPRDVDPKVSKIDDIYHYTVDDLNNVLEENLEKRRSASVQAEVIASQEVAEIVAKQRLKDLGYFMTTFKAANDNMVADVLKKAETKLSQGDDTELVLQTFSRQLTAKFTHAHFHLLKQAASLEDKTTLNFLVQELSQLYKLDEEQR